MSNVDTSIGGYFELELTFSEEIHKDSIRLNTGRNAFEYIPIRILQKYDSYYITKVIVTKEKNGYFATAFLKLKNGDITVTHKIEMKFQTDINSKKINYFTVIDGQNIE